MSTYLGNETLAPAVKERVLSTFQQTLALYKQGRTEEVVAGCGLILRMDPMFDPAKKLLEKTRNPQLAINVDMLVPSLPPAAVADPMAEARRAFEARDFQRAINITTEILTNDLMNDEARILNEQARDKMEASPFVEQFARKVEQHLTNNNAAAARSELEKARALDPDHPALKRLEQLFSRPASQPAPPPAAPSTFNFDSGSPSFVVDAPQTPSSGRSAAQAADFGFTFEEEKPASAPPSTPFGGFSFDSPAAPPTTPPPARPPAPTPPANAAPSGGFSFDAPSSTPAGGSGDALSNFSFDAPTPAAPPSGGFSFDAPAAPASGGFSFDSPSAFSSPSAPASEGPHTFDFTTAPTEMSPDDQRKIQQYLTDGDRAFEGGDFQQAVDLWSRIFLIDVTNEQASDRIERAKLKRREIESRVETVVAAGMSAYDRKDRDTARAKFLEALRMDPNNSAAQEYLDRLNDAGTEGGAVGYEVPFEPPPPKGDPLFDGEEVGEGYGAPLVPPDPGAVIPPPPTAAKAKAAPAKAKAPASSDSKKSPMTFLAILFALVVLGGGGWFAYTKFMNKAPAAPLATPATFRQAETLAAKGKYDQAIAILSDIKLEDPLHDRAIVTIAELKTKKQQASAMFEGKPATVYYQENLANGKTLYESHDYEGAKKAWAAAASVKPLPPDVQTLYSSSVQQAAKLDNAKALFKEAKYQDAILNLQPLLQQDPQNQNIQHIISDAHFNLGAAALQDERLPEAISQFDEVLKLNPNDDLARRSRELAARYYSQPKGTPKDLLYKIYVKYLPLKKVS
jgi:tetratricopeptide (TPR) repeat protein